MAHTHGGRPQRLHRLDLPRPQIRCSKHHLPLLLPGIYSPRGGKTLYYISNPGAVRTNTITFSIADNAVYQRALFSGTRGAYPGNVQFPDSVLASLEPTPTSPLAWAGALKLRFTPTSLYAHPTKLSLHFGTNRNSILTPQGTRLTTPPFNPSSRPNQRQAIAATYMYMPISPPIVYHLSFPILEDTENAVLTRQGFVLTLLAPNRMRSRSPPT